jgi:predicted phage terminase large subunit-like protein
MSNSSTLSPAQAATELLARRRARQFLAAFIKYLELGFVPALHHRLLIAHLEAVERGEIERLMVLMPPGSAKSTYASVLFPPWFMGRNREAAVLGISNTTDFAEYLSRRSRNLIDSKRYHNVFGFGMSDDSQAAGNWATEAGGEFFAAGMGSAIAGRRADLGLIDDPIKTREEADSERIRQKHWDWYINDFTTRLKPNARQILIQTRWHEDDLGGRILERESARWTVVKLPMVATASDPLDRKPGERLWPEWFTAEMVEQAKLDHRAWNALYQQDPAPEEGDFFQRDDFNDYLELPAQLHYYGASDYATQEGQGDYTEHGIFGLDYNGDLYAIDWWRDQTKSDVWIERQCDLILRYKPLIWFGEGGPIRRAIEPFLRKRMQEREALCRLEWLPSIGDKVERARAIQARCAMGKVWLPKAAGWKADLMSQLMRFPAGKYDDGVDVLSLVGRGMQFISTPKLQQPQGNGVHINRPRGPNAWMKTL